LGASNDVLPLYVVLKGKSVPKDVEHLVSEKIVIAAILRVEKIKV